ncbi:hypothetical protein CDL15_Pgr018193 [Punica granatum]|uniref:Carboxypeptidase n=1 Tax=Punica granatum TaxID=22663 RepID=A0A218WIH2_PUNGR|nr:hypothetical protein CDL15_Pgr018193 [Punica granatum]
MKLVRFMWSVGLTLLLSVTTVTAAPKDSLITSVPGFTGSLPSQHYAGYVTIDGNPAGEKNLFYYFVASERDSSKDPVVLWLNGGPGCSSFDGFVYEHGPFNFQPGNSGGSFPILQLNPYSWSKVSNIIYLDSPCGVGLSYSDNPSNYVTGDIQTTSDTHAFLLKWFELYPEFQANPFYISGESYAGVYVPMLASEVIKAIEGNQQPSINFKGYLVGNGIADDVFDGNGLVPFAFGMGLISIDIFADCQATCQGKYYDPPNPTCEKNLRRVSQALLGLNFYNILEPCYRYPSVAEGNQSSGGPSSFRQGRLTNTKHLTRMSSGRHFVRSSGRDGRVPLDSQLEPEFHVPCINDDLATAWLNDETVRKAIHAAPASVAGSWTICADRVDYTTEVDSMLPYHKNLTARGYRALIYRYLQAYDKNLTFLTIKGAGHMVPQYKPRESLDFFTRWLDGKPI